MKKTLFSNLVKYRKFISAHYVLQVHSHELSGISYNIHTACVINHIISLVIFSFFL